MDSSLGSWETQIVVEFEGGAVACSGEHDQLLRLFHTRRYSAHTGPNLRPVQRSLTPGTIHNFSDEGEESG